MLDRRRNFGEVIGEGVAGARWYQDGHYFAPDGRYLFSNPGISPPAGVAYRSLEDAEADYQRAQQAQASGVPVTAAKATPKKVAAPKPPAPGPLVQPQGQAPAAPIQADGLTREQELMQLNYFALANVVKAAGGEPMKGAGSKGKMIAWLLANTSE